MQKLPYVVVANPHISLVYELYYKAFERFRVVREIRSLDDNDRYCDILRETLKEHLTVIPNLAMGVLECQGLVEPDQMDRFMDTMLRAVGDAMLIVEPWMRNLTNSSVRRGFLVGLLQSSILPSLKLSTLRGIFRIPRREQTSTRISLVKCS
jgi:hypothetical protein